MKKFLGLLLIMALMMPMAAFAEETQTSLTTGLPTDQPYKPLVAVLCNDADARPLDKLSLADVVYEVEYTNGGYTRYVVVFNDEIPETVGSVRSARIMFLDMYLDWGGAFVHHGGQPHTETNVESYAKSIPMDGKYDGNSSKHFYRSDEKSIKHVNRSTARLTDIYNELTDDITPKSPLKFSAENPTIKGEDVTDFSITFRKGQVPGYQYDAERGGYNRLYNSQQQVDRQGVEITCENVIVMHTDYSWYAGDPVRPVVELTGDGVCEFFIGGKHFIGSWQRDSVTANTVYLDDEGNEVLLKPGKTFIHFVKEGRTVDIAS